MAVFMKPAVTGQEFEEYLAVGHLDDLSVVQSPEGMMYYAELDEEQQPAGTFIDRSLVRPIAELPLEMQYRIRHEF